ncbi:hypothetical protein NEMBOFW57_009152 [Staphylotrichum longicolle]|uniref:argininosuccinate lyase n=1 Tax=Staphylotrichum longicolle TaxID=669026 RepID=A0AAD4ETD1_9PEZI|nr:hypothetical protein NEMBOFW57_009152 [Staphylotrichum longicolle]
MAPTSAPTLLWGGRFTGAIDDLMFQFNESLSFDKVLYKADLHGSITWAKALRKLDILNDTELEQIVSGLQQIEKEWEEGKFVIDTKSDEDIHTANERRLGELIGDAAGKLHTGRSRNEQVGVDMRLWAGEQLAGIAGALKDLLSFMAKDLGFHSVHPTALGESADGSLEPSGGGPDPLLHAEFGFVQVADAYSTGSSLMPQKKNPDSLELIRGKAGRVMGQASGFLASLKSLPTSYNKDLQESVEPMIDCIKTVSNCVRITQGVIATLTIHGDKMKAALTDDMLATDIADYLVRKGVPFRKTHHIAGAIVRKAEEAKVSISALPLKDLQEISPLFEDDVAQVFDFERSVEQRSTYGGTSSSSVLAQIAAIEAFVGKN